MRPRATRTVVVAALVGVLAFPLGVLASHRFSDVPTTSPYHADVDALVDAGITSGCGGGRFCPSDYVTREQMAAFMNRLGALSPGKAPVVNADRVDGYDATQLMSFVAMSKSNAHEAIPEIPSELTFATIEIQAPATGFVLVHGSVTVFNSACSQYCDVSVRLHHRESATNGPYHNDTVMPAPYGSVAVLAAFPVQKGRNRFDVKLSAGQLANSTLYGQSANLAAQFSPSATITNQ